MIFFGAYKQTDPFSCGSLSLKITSSFRPRDLAALARSCRRLKAVAEDALYAFDRDHGSTAVGWAAEHGNIETLDKAFKHRLDIDETDLPCTPEYSPFQTAVAHGQDSAVAWFLDHGVDVTREVHSHCCCDYEKTCILHTATCLGHASTAQLLISRGAPLEYSLYYNENNLVKPTNALLEASLNGLDTVVESLFKDYGMTLQMVGGTWDQDALACAAMLDENVSTIKTLVGLGADVNGLHSDWSSSPLYIAIKMGNFAVAHTLLDLGAKIHPYEYDSDAHISSEGEEDKEKMGSATIRVNVEPLHGTIVSITRRPRAREWHDIQSPVKRTALQSWKAERDRCMKRLIDLGVDVNKQSVGDWHGSSPLDLAAEVGDVQDMTMLIAAGAEVTSDMLLLAWEDSERDAKESTAKFRLLLNHGARLDQPIQHGVRSMLQVAADHAKEADDMSGLHEILLFSSPKSLRSDHLDEVLAECLADQNWLASTVLVRHGARLFCQDKLFSIASGITEELGFETAVDNLADFEPENTFSGPEVHDCIGFIIDMGLSNQDQCLIFQDFLHKRQHRLTHLFLDRGLASLPEAAVFLPAYLMLAASWGNICVIKRLWQHAHEVSDAALRYSLVQQSIVSGNREAVSFFMERGATPFQHLTRTEASREHQMQNEALDAQLAALRRFDLTIEASPAGLCARRDYERTRLLTTRYGSDDDTTYLLPFLSPLQLAVRYGLIDIISDLLDHLTQSDAGAITACGNIYIPCVLSRANEIRDMIQKKGIECDSGR